jgi:hypothetical protein
VAKAVLDNNKTVRAAKRESADIMEWVRENSSEYYSSAWMEKKFVDWKLSNKTFDDLKIGELHQELEEHIFKDPYRMSRLLCNDGYSDHLAETVTSLCSNQDSSFQDATEIVKNYDCKAHKKCCANIARVIFKDGFDRDESVERLESGFLESNPKSKAKLWDQRRMLVDILIRHGLLTPSNYESFKVPDLLITRLSLLPEPKAPTSINYTEEGQPRQRGPLVSQSEKTSVSAVAPKMKAHPNRCNRDALIQAKVSNVENRPYARTVHESIPHTERVPIYPLDITITKDFGGDVGVHSAVLDEISEGHVNDKRGRPIQKPMFHVTYDDKDHEDLTYGDITVLRNDKQEEANQHCFKFIFPVNTKVRKHVDSCFGIIKAWVLNGDGLTYTVAYDDTGRVEKVSMDAIQKQYTVVVD